MAPKHYSEITMSLKERQDFLETHRDRFTPERFYTLLERLNNDRVAAAPAKAKGESA